MKSHASTPMVGLAFDVLEPAPGPPRSMFAASAAAPTVIEKAGGVLLLLATSAPIVVLGWVLSG